MKTALEKKFNLAVERWINHCSKPDAIFNSDLSVVRNCNAYKEILAMGKDALPLIRQLYDRSAGIHDLPSEKFPRKIKEMTEEEIKDSQKIFLLL